MYEGYVYMYGWMDIVNEVPVAIFLISSMVI